MTSLNSDRIAVGLYAVLTRDACDFIDMVIEEEDVEALKTLYLMLVTPNEDMNEHDRKWNALGAPIVEGNLKKRGVELPKIPKPPKEGQQEFKFGDAPSGN